MDRAVAQEVDAYPEVQQLLRLYKIRLLRRSIKCACELFADVARNGQDGIHVSSYAYNSFGKVHFFGMLRTWDPRQSL